MSASIDQLEDVLSVCLNPVEPDPVFVGKVHKRLTRPATVTLERQRSPALALLVLALGLFCGGLLVWLLLRRRSYS